MLTTALMSYALLDGPKLSPNSSGCVHLSGASSKNLLSRRPETIASSKLLTIAGYEFIGYISIFKREIDVNARAAWGRVLGSWQAKPIESRPTRQLLSSQDHHGK